MPEGEKTRRANRTSRSMSAQGTIARIGRTRPTGPFARVASPIMTQPAAIRTPSLSRRERPSQSRTMADRTNRFSVMSIEAQRPLSRIWRDVANTSAASSPVLRS